jgi:hypothetical protein
MLAVSAFAPAVSAADVWATVTGYAEGTPANNNVETWGDNCSKLDGDNIGDTYTLTQDWDLVVVKAGSESSAPGFVNTLFANPLAGQTVWADSDGNGSWSEGDKGISHIIFCGDEPEETPTPTPEVTPTPTPEVTPTPTPTGSELPEESTEPTPTPTPEVTPTPTPEVTPTPTPEVTPTPTPEVTPTPTPEVTPTPTPEVTPTPTGSELPEESSSSSPSGGVEGATGTPGITPPPTDTLGGNTQAPSNDGWRIVLLGLAAILAATLAFTTPRPATRRER